MLDWVSEKQRAVFGLICFTEGVLIRKKTMKEGIKENMGRERAEQR